MKNTKYIRYATRNFIAFLPYGDNIPGDWYRLPGENIRRLRYTERKNTIK